MNNLLDTQQEGTEYRTHNYKNNTQKHITRTPKTNNMKKLRTPGKVGRTHKCCRLI